MTPHELDANRVLSQWEGIVEELKGAYQGDYDDYINDLGTRDGVELLLPLMDEAQLQRVEIADHTYKMRTVEVVEHIFIDRQGFWWYRIPFDNTPHAQDSFDRMGILPVTKG